MATIKELQAKFTSNASGMESAFTAMTNKLNDIEKASNRAANSMEKNMSRGMNKVFKTGEGFKKVSSSLENISKKSVELGNNLTKKITKPALAVGGALAGITIGKGFGRLVEIDNAKAKLEGLGHSGKNVKGIMDNALESVKGTSYGLGEAATTASSAVAAGIEPGKELTRYLSLTGDAAAIAGTSMGEMGSIINKVQTSNKAYNGELQQLSERGIPIYQWIAKEAGVTADAVFDMASDGKISSEMFLNAIETNIGGAAKKMGQKSFTAGLANMWAAVGRLGASFLDAGGKGGGFFSKMKPLMEELTNSLDGMESTAAKWGESLGKAFDKIVEGIRGIIGWYNSLDKNTQKLINSVIKWSALTLVAVGPILKIFGKLTGVIGAVFGPFGKFLQFIAKFSTATKSAEGAIAGVAKVFPRLGSALGLITGPVGWITLGIIALGTAFVVAYKKSEKFRNGVNGAFEIIKVFTKGIGGAIISGLKNLGGWLGDVGKRAKDFGKALYDSWAKTEVGKQRIEQWNDLKDAAKKVFDTIADGSKRATDTTDVLGEGVSKGTKKALQKYVDFSEGSIRALEKIKIDGGKLNKETQKELSDSIKNGAEEAIKAVKDRNKEIESNLRKALENSVSISDEEKKNLIEKTQEASNEKVKKLEKLNEEIAKLEEKQYTDGKLTAKETDLLKSKLKERNELTIEYVAKGAEEQRAILSRMDANVAGLSNQEISKALKSSAKAEKKAIKEAAKIRDEGIKEADKALQDGSINKGEHRSIVLDLESEYNHAVDTAKKKSKEVQDTVEKGNKGIWTEMDREGHAYSGAEKMWNNYKLAMELFFNKTNIGIIFNSIGAVIKSALNTMFTAIGAAIGNFFIGIGQKIAVWWNKGLEESKESFMNLGSFLSKVVGGIGTFFTENAEYLKNAGSQIWKLIKQGWTIAIESSGNLLSGLISKLGEWWEITKGFFTGLGSRMGGALKQGWNSMMTNVGSFFGNLWQTIQLGMGTVKEILFTLWQGISTTVVNLVQGMGRGISRVFQSIWGITQNIFGTLRGWLESLWIRVRNFVVDRAYSMWTGTSNAFTGLWNSVLGIFGVLRDWVISTWQNIRNSVVNRATSLWRGVSGRFTNLWNSTQNIFNILRDWLISTWQNIRNSVVNKAGSLWSGVSSRFWGLWDSVRNVTSTLRNWVIDTWDYIRSRLTSLAERVKDGVTSPFYKMRDIVQNVLNSTKGFIDDLTSKVKSGLNKVIDGMNKIGDFIGIDAKIPKLHTGTHSTHTQDFVTNGAINKDTMAVVGDKGRGNGPKGFRHEMIEDNKGNLSLTPDKDTVVPLKKGYKVHNGRSTHNFLSSMLGSNIPKFADGTFLGGIKKKKDDLFSMISGGMGKGMGKVTGKAAAAFEKAIGDIDDWMDKPKKLLEKMFDHFGVDQFKSVSGNIGDLTKGMFSRLKKGLIQQIKDWFEESQEGGDGDAAWLLSGKYPLLQEFGYYKGMTMNGTDRHWGLDFGMPEGTKIKALTDGKITQAGWVNGGGGNQVTLEEPGGKWFQWYMHMMNGGIKVKAGQKVKAGDLLGLSGNTGSSNTPHLHIQRMKGYPSNDTAVDPMDWLKSLGSGGGKKSSSKWRGEIQKAAKKMNVSLSSGELNDIASLINKESGGDPKIMQKIHDQNSGPNAARGLLQYTPGTFGSYATKAGKNILNGYHQLLAFFNNSNWRRDLSSWKSRMAMGITGWGPSGSNRGYATGGIVNSPQMAWLAEGGFSESVISHDPSMKARSKVLYDKTGDMLGFNEDTDLLREIIEQLNVGNSLQSINNRDTNRIANKDTKVYLDGKDITNTVNYRQGKMLKDRSYIGGGN